jgi:hypothetical protein
MRHKSFLILLILLATTGPAFAGYPVGVVMGNNGCPNGAPPRRIYIDNEDYRNENSHAGWIGSTISTANTDLYFCEIEGTTLPVTDDAYMVLNLGPKPPLIVGGHPQCPPGSRSIIRTIDAEDTRDGPDSYSDIPGVLFNNPVNVMLHLCLFETSGPPLASGFPNIGVEYGVLAASSFRYALQTGYVYMDDEDALTSADRNANMWQDAKGEVDSTYVGISGDQNTVINFVRVHGGPSSGCSIIGAEPPLGMIFVLLLALLLRRQLRRAT